MHDVDRKVPDFLRNIDVRGTTKRKNNTAVLYGRHISSIYSYTQTVRRDGFKAESLLGHINRNASSPFPSPPSPPLFPPFPPLDVGPSNPAMGSGGAL